MVLRIDDSRNCTEVSLANGEERLSIVSKLPAAIVSFEMLKGAIGCDSLSRSGDEASDGNRIRLGAVLSPNTGSSLATPREMSCVLPSLNHHVPMIPWG